MLPRSHIFYFHYRPILKLDSLLFSMLTYYLLFLCSLFFTTFATFTLLFLRLLLFQYGVAAFTPFLFSLYNYTYTYFEIRFTSFSLLFSMFATFPFMCTTFSLLLLHLHYFYVYSFLPRSLFFQIRFTTFSLLTYFFLILLHYVLL